MVQNWQEIKTAAGCHGRACPVWLSVSDTACNSILCAFEEGATPATNSLPSTSRASIHAQSHNVYSTTSIKLISIYNL